MLMGEIIQTDLYKSVVFYKKPLENEIPMVFLIKTAFKN